MVLRKRHRLQFLIVGMAVALAAVDIAASSNKFFAWAYTWGEFDTRIPTMTYRSDLPDVRQQRQSLPFLDPYGEFPPNPGGTGPVVCDPRYAVAWINADPSRRKGFTWILCDEPEAYIIPTPQRLTLFDYVYQVNHVIKQIRSVDPTARFSTAFMADQTVNEDFYSMYRQYYLGVAGESCGSDVNAPCPPIAEWGFHNGGDMPTCNTSDPNQMQGFTTAMNAKADWAVDHGAPMFTSLSLWYCTDPDVPGTASKMFDWVKGNAKVVGTSWWAHYDYELGAFPGELLDGAPSETKSLTATGAVFLNYVTEDPSVRWSGAGPLVDFTGLDADGKSRADVAFYNGSNGEFSIRKNCGGVEGNDDPADCDRSTGETSWFAYGPWKGSTTFVPSWARDIGWRERVAQSAGGDLFGDVLHLYGPAADGYVFHYQNNGSGGFDYNTYTYGRTPRSGSDREIIMADFTGDSWADQLTHVLDTGLLYIHARVPSGGNNTGAYASVNSNAAVGRAMVGAGWRLLVADFTGDGLADFADQHIASGVFWIHQNVGSADGFRFSAANWAVVSAGSGPSYKTIVGDFNGDAHADYADLDTATGNFYIHENKYGGTAGVFRPATAGHLGWGPSPVSSGWRLLGQ